MTNEKALHITFDGANGRGLAPFVMVMVPSYAPSADLKAMRTVFQNVVEEFSLQDHLLVHPLIAEDHNGKSVFMSFTKDLKPDGTGGKITMQVVAGRIAKSIRALCI